MRVCMAASCSALRGLFYYDREGGDRQHPEGKKKNPLTGGTGGDVVEGEGIEILRN